MLRDQVHMLVDLLFDHANLPVNQEALGHLKNARREALLGARALIDAALAKETPAPAGRGTARIPVEE